MRSADEVLQARARALSARARAIEPEAAVTELISFELGREVYALESRYIRNVFRIMDLSLLPGSRAPVYGVTNWRGTLLTLLDLRGVVGETRQGIADLNHALVLGVERASFGVLSGRMRELLRVPAADVVATEAGKGRRGYVQGVTPGGVLVLDAERLLNEHG
jgi:purine-binding chemotaxis protein CheW